ncbi:jg21919 [Pararge aegeria aegeria]|uniref:Jg21919 protein n=1 Tax=Pararge aegeria aegeria TaxID=348720 RepID=A0A8S4QN50_9NEOP|nr:jg21919 [Pararge aegeria aegeria]
MKKDRGDQIKKNVKPKAVPKIDAEATKDFVKDRGDSVPKTVGEKFNPRETKHNDLNNHLVKKSVDFVAVRGVPKYTKNILKNVQHSEAISLDKSVSNDRKQNEPEGLYRCAQKQIKPKGLDLSVPKITKRNEPKSSEKSGPNDTIKPIKPKDLDKSAANNIKLNEPKSLDKCAPGKGNSLLIPLNTKSIKSKNLVEKYGPVESVNTKHNEILSRRSKKLHPISLVTDKGDSKTVKDKKLKSTKHDEVQNMDESKNIVYVAKKNVVKTEKHVSRLLDVDEKKRIREKYTFKPNAKAKNNKIDVNSNLEDSPVEDNNEKSRKRPIITTIVAKNDATKVYKAVSFAKQKRELSDKVLIKHININIPNDALAEYPKIPALPKPTYEDNLKENMKNPKKSQNNDKNLIKNMKTPNISQVNDENLLRNMKKLMTHLSSAGSLVNNTKTTNVLDSNNPNLTKNPKISTDTLLGTSKITKLLQCEAIGMKKFAKAPKIIQNNNSVSRTSVRTKISKKDKRKRLKCKLSRFSLSPESASPETEVAKWAPNSIDEHTKPYYEAWVTPTLSAVSRDPKKDKLYHENQKLIKTLKKLMERESESYELIHENYMDARFTGKIKINHRQ